VTITKHGRPVACLKPVVDRPKSIWGFAKHLIGEDSGDPGTDPIDVDWGPDPAELALYGDDGRTERRSQRRSSGASRGKAAKKSRRGSR
jgi:antitoxin (DNA-binding transcriptional repressor) of toxin-antitoxin stability system